MESKYKIAALLFLISVTATAFSQKYFTSISGVEYKLNYKVQQSRDNKIISCSISIHNNSNEKIYLPTYRSFYILSENYFIQKLGVLYKDVTSFPTVNGGPVTVMLLNKGDSIKFELTCSGIQTIIPPLLLSIDFVFASKLRKKDFLNPREILVDGKPIDLKRDTFLISLNKYKAKSVWVNANLEYNFP